MICNECKLELPDRDFFLNNKSCYRCIYAMKVKKTKNKIKKNHCRICRKEVFFDVNAKKRQRSVFCSYECAEIGQRELMKKYWTNRLTGYFPCYID